MRVVACCSTLPERAENGKLERAVRSILGQTANVDRVYVHYPYRASRLQVDYPPPPVSLVQNPQVEVVRCEDHGPLTKVYPVANVIDAADTTTTAIVLFDDDRVYPNDWLEPLLWCFEANGGRCGVGYHGSSSPHIPFFISKFNTISLKPIPVAILATAWMTVYPRQMLYKDGKTCVERLHAMPKSAFTNDDIVLGSWAHRHGVRLLLTPINKTNVKRWGEHNLEGDDTQSLARSFKQQMKQVNLTNKLVFTNGLPMPFMSILTLLTLCLLIMGAVALCLHYAKPSHNK